METMAETVSDIRRDIRNANDNFENAFARGDAKAMAALYTPDAILLPPGAPIQRGSNGIENFWKMVMDMGIKEVNLTTSEIEEMGETAVEVGEYKLTGSNNNPVDNGKYLVVWKKEMGSWKLHKDIWNTSVGVS